MMSLHVVFHRPSGIHIHNYICIDGDVRVYIRCSTAIACCRATCRPGTMDKPAMRRTDTADVTQTLSQLEPWVRYTSLLSFPLVSTFFYFDQSARPVRPRLHLPTTMPSHPPYPPTAMNQPHYTYLPLQHPTQTTGSSTSTHLSDLRPPLDDDLSNRPVKHFKPSAPSPSDAPFYHQIPSSHDAGPHKAKEKVKPAKLACLACRKRKARCPGPKPVCHTVRDCLLLSVARSFKLGTERRSC